MQEKETLCRGRTIRACGGGGAVSPLMMNPERDHRRQGVAAIWIAMLMLLIVTLVGLTIDAGFISLTGQQLWVGADAAALAGAQLVKTDQDGARQAAIDLALANKAAGDTIQLRRNSGNDAAGDIVVGVFDRNTRTFTPTTTSPNAVKVVARRNAGSLGGPLPLLFGPSFGAPTTEVTHHSIAMIQNQDGIGLLVLNPTLRGALKFTGNTTLIIESGAIQVNSDNQIEAVIATGSGPTITAESIDVVGVADIADKVNYDGPINEGVSSVPDPLASLPAPPIVLPDRVGGKQNSSRTYQPGYYSKGIIMSGGATATLLPGIYVLDDIGLKTSGSGTAVIADGVLIYLKGPKGALDLGGTGLTRITPMTSSGTAYDGISIFQAHGNTQKNGISGPNPLQFEGVVYLPDAELIVGSNSVSEGGLGSQLIVSDVIFSSNSVFRIPQGTRFGASNAVFLVE